MVKKTIIAIAAVVLLVAVFVGAYNWGYTRYGAVYYYGEPFYMYYPLNSYPYYPYNGVYYPYNVPYVYPYEPGPLASDLLYRYGAPSVAYPAGVSRSRDGQLCGIIDSTQFGCDYGLVCDYTKTSQKGIGVCSVQTTYPYYG